MAKKLTTVVIGSGVSGMTAALVLARFGHDVSLIERSPVLGLTIRGFYRQGVYFDTGLHYTGGLGEKGPLTRYLRFLGMGGLATAPFNQDEFDTIRFAAEGREIRLCAGHERLRERMRGLFPNEGHAIDAYFAEAHTIFDSSSFINFNFGTDFTALLAAESEYDSLAVFLAKRTNDPLLRAVLSIHSLLHGTSPKEVSFLHHARVAASYFDSAHTFAGGGRALVLGFENCLADAGVRVIRGNGVSLVNFSTGNAIDGVTLDDKTMLDADTVVYTGHPSLLPDIMPQGIFKPAYTRRLQSLEETPSASMLFGISDKPVAPLEGGNLFLCPDTDLEAFFIPGRDVAKGPFYATMSPGGGNNGKGYGITVVGPGAMAEVAAWENTVTGKRDLAYAEFKAAMMERFRDAVVAACPEMAAVRFIDGATPLTLRDYTHSPTGSLYGCKHSMHQFNPQPVTRVPNFWLAGQSIVAPGVLGAMISSFVVCEFIIGRDVLRKEIAACG